MKLAVIFGVVQMLLGIFLKSLNAVYNNDFIEYLFEFWPQFILMWCWFGYMSILIITKWLTFYPDTSVAPSIIAFMIDMFLKFGEVEREPILYDVEKSVRVNQFLLIVSFTCIPLMLLVRPIHALVTQEKHPEHDSTLHGVKGVAHTSHIRSSKDGFHRFEDEEELPPNARDLDAIDRALHQEEEKHHFNEFVRSHTSGRLQDDHKDNENSDEHAMHRQITSRHIADKNMHSEAMKHLSKCVKVVHETHGLEEIFVHQLIETIEFVLGTISNTASYLRLWALSLAHSQLAAVFYEKTLELGIESQNSVVLFFVQQGFWAATLGVLMSMDSLECFLHTLRLHWVEFQNKFYKGTGVKFTPL